MPFLRLPGGGLGYFASNFLIFLTSAGATVTSPASRRVTRDDLCSNRCLRFARRRNTFPEPVSRNRLLAPLCVFILGMFAVVSISYAPGGAAFSCVPPAGSPRAARCRASTLGPAALGRARTPSNPAPSPVGGEPYYAGPAAAGSAVGAGLRGSRPASGRPGL